MSKWKSLIVHSGAAPCVLFFLKNRFISIYLYNNREKYEPEVILFFLEKFLRFKSYAVQHEKCNGVSNYFNLSSSDIL